MNPNRIKKRNFNGEILISEKLNPDLIDILTSKDNLLIIAHGKPPYKVAIGVPHQAAIGEANICEKNKQRDSDKNAASYALVAFSKLKEKNIPCKLVIMAHSTNQDPNKELDSPYCKELFRDPTELIFECHGAAQRRNLDLELSAGKNKLSETEKFGRLLAEELDHKYGLGIQKNAGTNAALIIGTDGTEKEGTLQMPANLTKSLIEAQKKRIPALHIEAKPQFRIPNDKTNTVSPINYRSSISSGDY